MAVDSNPNLNLLQTTGGMQLTNIHTGKTILVDNTSETEIYLPTPSAANAGASITITKSSRQNFFAVRVVGMMADMAGDAIFLGLTALHQAGDSVVLTSDGVKWS